jgi:hypothetical protein
MTPKILVCGAVVLAMLAGRTMAQQAAPNRSHQRGQFMAKLLEKYDTDKDGKLSDTEKAAMKADLKANFAKGGQPGQGEGTKGRHAGMKGAAGEQAKGKRGGMKAQAGDQAGGKRGDFKAKRAELMAKLLAKYDTDKDGKLSDTEKAAMKADLKAKFAEGGKGMKGGRGGFGAKGGHKAHGAAPVE